MDNAERKVFWDTLKTLKGVDIKTESEELLKTIKCPRYLYRYRSVNTNSLEALRTNKTYYSSANYYDDPFDTFLNIDINGIVNEIIQEIKDPNYVQEFLTELNKENYRPLLQSIGVMQGMPLTYKNLLELFTPEHLKQLTNNLGEFRNIIKSDTWSICFSEDGFNETLWLKYADQHKGFALIYDMDADEDFFCFKEEECKNCKNGQNFPSLYPLYYSNEHYDATKFAQFMMKRILEDRLHKPGLLDRILPVSNQQAWERERISLIKKECHHYDKEWRMIVTASPNFYPFLKWKPSGVILGLKMKTAEQNLVISLAKQAGIEKIYKSVITNEGILDAKRI